MSIATYAELKSAVQSWLDYTDSGADLVSRIPDFISLAESEIKADLDARVLMKTTTPALLAANTLPADYGTIIVVKLYDAATDKEQGELLYATANEIARNRSRYGDGGNPTHYTIEGNTIQVFPSSDSTDYKWGMTYYSHPSLGPADDDTNELLKEWPGLYLYGALLHSAPFLDEDTRVITWQSRYDTAVNKANIHAEDSEAGTSQIGMPEGASW